MPTLDYERYVFTDLPLTAIWPKVKVARRFIDMLEDPGSPSTTISTELAVVVPPSGKIDLWYDPADSPILDAYLDVWTATGQTGTQFTKVTGTGVLGPYEVRVFPEHPSWIDVSTERADETIYITLVTSFSSMSATWANRLEREVNAMATSFSEFYYKAAVATEAISADMLVKVYHDGVTLKMRLGDATDPENWPNGYCPSAVSNGAIGYFRRFGDVASFGTSRTPPPSGVKLFVSKAPGYYTWLTDSNSTYNLDTGNAKIEFGDTYDGNNGMINLITPFVLENYQP